MNREKLLNLILSNENLKNKYWPEEDITKWNSNNLVQANNKYIKALDLVINEKQYKNYMKNSLSTIFSI